MGKTETVLDWRQSSSGATKEPIVEQLGQDTPSVIQGARPEQRYGSQPYFSGQQYTAPTTAAQPYTAVPQPYNAAAQPYTAAAQPYIAPYNNMPAMSARPTELNLNCHMNYLDYL